MNTSRQARARQQAIKWAQRMLTLNPVLFDFETTGLKDAEIVQIGVIDVSGAVLMDTLVRPSTHIPSEVVRIHGITDAMVIGAPTFTDLYAQFSVLLAGKTAIAYNVSYDKGILQGECKRRKLPPPRVSRWECAMKTYADFFGAWSDQHRTFKFQSLTNACVQQKVALENAHNAIADCKATLALIHAMANAPSLSDIV